MITHSDDGPDFDPDDPLAVILRPPADLLGPPAGRYEAIRRGAVRRKLLRAAAGAGLLGAVTAAVALPVLLAPPERPVSPTVPLAPPSVSGPPTPSGPPPSPSPDPVKSRTPRTSPSEGSGTPGSPSTVPPGGPPTQAATSAPTSAPTPEPTFLRPSEAGKTAGTAPRSG